MRGGLVSRETIVLINPWLNNIGNLQSCRNTSWWIPVEGTCLYWIYLNPGRHQSQPQGRLDWRQSAGYMISKSSPSKVRAAEGRGASGRCIGWDVWKEKWVSGFSGWARLCHKYKPTHAVGSHTYMWTVMQESHHRLSVWIWSLPFCSFNPRLFLFNVVPAAQLTAWQCARRAVWPFLSLE